MKEGGQDDPLRCTPPSPLRYSAIFCDILQIFRNNRSSGLISRSLSQFGPIFPLKGLIFMAVSPQAQLSANVQLPATTRNIGRIPT